MRDLLTAALVLILCGLAGCSSPKLPVWPADLSADEHVIAIDQKGRTVRPGQWPTPEQISPKANEYDQQLDRIFAAMDQWHAKNPNLPRRILIFVHGGLTPPQSALNRAAIQTPLIEAAGYFPLFIVWNPALASCYGEHVDHIRRGEYEDDSYWLAPFYVLADIGRALTRFPIIWSFQAGNDFSRISAAISGAIHDNPDLRWLDNPQFANAIEVTDLLVSEYASPDPKINENAVRISLGDVKGNAVDSFSHVGVYVATVPAKFALSPLLDSLGTAGWDAMYRRADILFDGFTTDNLHTDRRAAVTFVHPGPGALVQFIQRLQERCPERAGGTQLPQDWELTVVGHSMGAIVLDEFVRRSGDLHLANIVYMGAACSVRDFQRTVVPYMQQHPRSNFYNLCLHPVNETRDTEGTELLPRGTLLVWIDDMFANAYTALDRTLGRWENISETIYVIPQEIRNRVHLKGFPADLNARGTAPFPQTHGDFSEFPYWNPSFWQPAGPSIAVSQNLHVRDKAVFLRAQRLKQAPHDEESPQSPPGPSTSPGPAQ